VLIGAGDVLPEDVLAEDVCIPAEDVHSSNVQVHALPIDHTGTIIVK
jgi:hypothetical protein